MPPSFYFGYRLASGFALVIAGLSLVLARGPDHSRKPTGVIFLSTGFLFLLSALDPNLSLSPDISNILVVGAIFAMSQSLMELAVYLLGGERNSGSRRKTYLAGGLWSAFLVVFPLFDRLLGLGGYARSVEDGRVLGPLHYAAAFLVYAWPIAATFLSFRLARGRIRDMPTDIPAVRGLASALAILIAILVMAALGGLINHAGLYRLSHTFLQTFLLAWFLLQSRYPTYSLSIRNGVSESRSRKPKLSEADIETIRLKIAQSVEDGTLLEEGVDIAYLSRRLSVPAFKVSAYLNEQLGKSFPDWLNDFRIRHACGLMELHPDRTILELAFECGYSSKTTFNNHFLRVMGMSPREYRKKRTDSRNGTSIFP